MVIAAHPDDADFGPAATAARWIDEGSVGWLVCCTSGDQGGEDPDIDPLELAAHPRARAAGRGRRRRLRGRDVPAHARRRARERPHPPRAPRARDSHLPPGRGPRDRSGERVSSRRRREPHGSPRCRLGRRGRRLPGRAEPDGVPVARERRAGEARRPAAVLLLDAPAQRLRRHLDDRRPEARCPALPREPDPGLRGGRAVDPRVVRRARARRSASRTPTGFYSVVIDDDDEDPSAEAAEAADRLGTTGWNASVRCGRSRRELPGS